MVRHQLREPVDLAIAHLEHASGVLEHRARLQLTKGDDLRHRVAAVFLLHVADHLAAPRFAEIDVDVRSEEHTSELQSLMRTSYAVFCLTNKHTLSHTLSLTIYHALLYIAYIVPHLISPGAP